MKIFVLLSRVPYPLEKGDKLRAYNQVAKLNEKHEVFLCCLNIGKLHPQAKENLSLISSRSAIIQLNPFYLILRLIRGIFTSKPFQVQYFYQKKASRKIDRLLEDFKPDHIYCQLVRTTEYVKEKFHIPKTLDYMDALSKGMERRVASAPIYLKPFLREEAIRLTIYENLIFEYFENKTIISAQDQRLIYHPNRDQIRVIPNGVDTSFYHPLEREKEYDLLFTGNMHYPPNVDSVEFLVQEILPLIHQERPETTLLISGVNPSKRVQRLASDHVTITGWVDDLRESYSAARIFVAPMNIGTGLQNKLLEAMAMKLPCATSQLANNALNAENNESIVIGRTPVSFANAVLFLLNNPQERARIAENGYHFVREKFDTNRNAQRLKEVMEASSMVAPQPQKSRKADVEKTA